MIGSTLGSPQWRGTYGILALAVAFAGGLLVYHRVRREGTHNADLSAAHQEALYDLTADPGRAAGRLAPLVEKSSASRVTPWLLNTLGAAYARQARTAEGATRTELLGKALDAYQTLIDRHPDHPAAPLAAMARGQLFEDMGGDDLSAAAAYAGVFETYPDSPVAGLLDARFGVRAILEKDRKDPPPHPRAAIDILRMKIQAGRRNYQAMLTEAAKQEAQQKDETGKGEPEKVEKDKEAPPQ